MLSETEIESLERYRGKDFGIEDAGHLADAMLRLYPPGWNDPVTPERLVEIGFSASRIEKFNPSFHFEGSKSSLSYWPASRSWFTDSKQGCFKFPDHMQPRNMQEARQLLERCGAIKEAKSH